VPSGCSTVILRYGDDEREATGARKDGHVSQQDVESNKHLGRILEQVRHDELRTRRGDASHGQADAATEASAAPRLLRRVGAAVARRPPVEPRALAETQHA
jgi:hypothetical protein